MKLSTNRNFVFFGVLGWAFAGVACSASPVSTGSGVGGSSNPGAATGGSAFNTTAGSRSVVDDVLQPDGTMKLHGTIRDFHKTYPDIQPCKNATGKLCSSDHVEQNSTPSDTTVNCGAGSAYPHSCFVQTTLGPDGKPQYVTDQPNGTVTTTGPNNYHYWFNDDTSVDPSKNPSQAINWPMGIDLFLQPNGDGTYKYQNLTFFPIDNLLFGDEGETDGSGNPHNYGFTTEFHLTFTYQKGQTFQFQGDDDLLLFIDGNLVVDRSGIHSAQPANLDLDVLGLAAGQDYSFDLFYCERNPPDSEITVTTSMQLKGTVSIQ